jgi:hypothetical protein
VIYYFIEKKDRYREERTKQNRVFTLHTLHRMNSSLDISRLEKVKHGGSRTSARCPACAAAGGDKTGSNLSIRSSDGAFTCAVYPGEAGREHRREIFALVGIKTERDPAEDREWRRSRVKMAGEEMKRNRITSALLAKRTSIIAANPWNEAQVRADSPDQRIGRFHDPRLFLAALFAPDAVVWTGAVNQSGTNHAARWRTVEAWQDAPEHTVGPMVSPATWTPGTVSRSAANVLSSPYVVLDFDGFDGKAPGTPEELREHVAASLAIVRWMRESLAWNLAAILFTGSKSIHAWFHTPPQAALESLRHTAPALGVDAGLIGRPEHPCRVPGWAHPKTGKRGRVLWLQV